MILSWKPMWPGPRTRTKWDTWVLKTGTGIYIWKGKNETNEAEYDRWIINEHYQGNSKETGLRSLDKVSKVGCPDKVQSWEYYHDHADDWVEAGNDVIVEELGTFKCILYTMHCEHFWMIP